MKIGVITHPLADNYGGILQAVSLCGYLAGQGHDVVLLRRHISRAAWKKFIVFMLEKIPFQNVRNYRFLAKKRARQESFIDRYLPNKTPIVYTTEQLVSILREQRFDAVIVGSDQVWRMKYIDDGHFGNYFLDFVDHAVTKKIAYGASFGSDEWEAPQKVGDVRRLLECFTAVSVREQSGVDICRELFCRSDCQLVLDPTLLVKRSFHESFVREELAKDKELLVYVLDKSSEKQLVINKVAELCGADYRLRDVHDHAKSILTVDEWVSAIRNSDYIVTDSYHGMIFSIIFHKKFIAIGNKERGMARFNSLASMLGLGDRVIASSDQVGDALICDIDYLKVDELIQKMRNISEAFLRESLR